MDASRWLLIRIFVVLLIALGSLSSPLCAEEASVAIESLDLNTPEAAPENDQELRDLLLAPMSEDYSPEQIAKTYEAIDRVKHQYKKVALVDVKDFRRRFLKKRLRHYTKLTKNKILALGKNIQESYDFVKKSTAKIQVMLVSTGSASLGWLIPVAQASNDTVEAATDTATFTAIGVSLLSTFFFTTNQDNWKKYTNSFLNKIDSILKTDRSKNKLDEEPTFKEFVRKMTPSAVYSAGYMSLISYITTDDFFTALNISATAAAGVVHGAATQGWNMVFWDWGKEKYEAINEELVENLNAYRSILMQSILQLVSYGLMPTTATVVMYTALGGSAYYFYHNGDRLTESVKDRYGRNTVMEVVRISELRKLKTSPHSRSALEIAKNYISEKLGFIQKAAEPVKKTARPLIHKPTMCRLIFSSSP